MHDVSIVIPLYKNRDRIGKAITSVLEQPDVDARVVVVIDDQCRASEALCRSFGERVAVVWNERNRGAQYSRNAGLALVTTPWVMFLDSDDWIEGRLLGGICDAVEEQDADWGYGPFVQFFEATGERISRPLSRLPEAQLFCEWMVGRHWVPPCAVLWRTERVREIGGWDEEVVRNQDGELAMRALLRGLRVAVSASGAGVYVDHSAPHRISQQKQQYAAMIVVLDKLMTIPNPQIDAATIRKAAAHGYYEAARRAFQHRDWSLGRHALCQARAFGFNGHRGSTLARMLSRVVGLENRMRVGGLFRH